MALTIIAYLGRMKWGVVVWLLVAAIYGDMKIPDAEVWNSRPIDAEKSFRAQGIWIADIDVKVDSCLSGSRTRS